MNLESLTVALRPRTAWEAVELGTALARRHAAAIWKPWLLLTIPALVLCNLLAWSVDMLWAAPLLMWWLKPLFDRIPLYVLSHAVFGDVPGTVRTLRAQLHWGLRWMPAYLSWRRLGPARALNLPIDLLEGGRGDSARQRRRALAGPAYGVGMLVTATCLHFELAVYLGLNSLAFLFIPPEYLPGAWEGVLAMLGNQPLWLDLATNALLWLATCAIEPFYVGAGFGLYLNRRTEIEGWDIEIVLRRLAARIAHAGSSPGVTMAGGLLAGTLLTAVLLVGAGVASPAHAQAVDEDPPRVRPLSQRKLDKPAPETTATGSESGLADDGDADTAPGLQRDQLKKQTLPRVFDDVADAGSLREAVARAYDDPSVTRKRTVKTWQRRDRDEPAQEEDKPRTDLPFLKGIGTAIALLGKYGLWLLLGALAIALLATSPRWLRWLRGAAAAQRREPEPAVREALDEPAPLPDDIPTAARRLWRDGHPREALSLLYRASVEVVRTRANVVLVPGATESTCLRASRRMPEAADREAFASMVRLWQYAAYAGRLPDTDAFERLLDTLAPRFGWGRGSADEGTARGDAAHGGVA